MMMKHSSTNTWLTLAAATLLQLHLVAVSIRAASASQLQVKEQKWDACRFSFSGGFVDLSPLDWVNRSGEPRFSQFARVLIGGIRYDLTYNPCSGFACRQDKAAAICAKDIYHIGLAHDVASQLFGIISQVNDGTLQIRYGSSDQTRSFLTVVTLVCNSSSDGDTLTGVQMSEANVLTFQLVSKHCCLVSPPTFNGGWSLRLYIVLAFILALFLYFIIFLTIIGLIRKRSGLDFCPIAKSGSSALLPSLDPCLLAAKEQLCVHI